MLRGALDEGDERGELRAVLEVAVQAVRVVDEEQVPPGVGTRRREALLQPGGEGGGVGEVLRALRVTTDMPVVPTTRLQLSYSYRVGAQFPIGQVLEARILRRLNPGW